MCLTSDSRLTHTDIRTNLTRRPSTSTTLPPPCCYVPVEAADGISFLDDAILQVRLLGPHHCKVITETLAGRHGLQYSR